MSGIDKSLFPKEFIVRGRKFTMRGETLKRCMARNVCLHSCKCLECFAGQVVEADMIATFKEAFRQEQAWNKKDTDHVLSPSVQTWWPVLY